MLLLDLNLMSKILARRSMIMRDSLLVCDATAILYMGIAPTKIFDWNNSVFEVFIQKQGILQWPEMCPPHIEIYPGHEGHTLKLYKTTANANYNDIRIFGLTDNTSRVHFQ